MTVNQTNIDQVGLISSSELSVREPLVLAESETADQAADGSMLAALPVVSNFFAALNRDGLRYCHWKSNLRLGAAVSGQTDLDLLIDPSDREAFQLKTRQFNIKRTFAAPGRKYPALENYIGFDPSTGRLFHLHVHYQLVLGEQFVKNYHLPLEALFFDSVRFDHGLKIAPPDFELIVLSLRALLKYRDRDVFKDILKIRSPGLPAPILKEVSYLQARTSEESLSIALTKVSDILPTTSIKKFLEVTSTRPRSGWQLLRLRSQVRRGLRPYQRNGRLRASVLYFQELWRRRKKLRLTPQAGKMTLPGGGTTVAFIGADGSGKSTMTKVIQKWLNWKLDVRTFYLGSKKPSQRSRLIYQIFRASRRSHRAVRRYAGEARFPTRLMGLIRQKMLDFHALSIAYDRLGYYQTGCRAAEAGSIVIFDRFPLKDPLDGPRIMGGPAEGSTSITRFLSQMEQRVYDRFSSPDLFMVLRVTPEVSLRRKPDHDPAAINAKCKAIDEFLNEQTDSKIRVIDAVQPYEQVLSELKNWLWEEL